MAQPLDYAGPGARRTSSLTKIGGALAVAGSLIGLFIFLGGCFGFGAAFTLSIIPLVLGSIGLVLTFVGGFFQRDIGMEDAHVVAAIVINLAVILGALMEMAVWRGWRLFA